MQVYCVQRLPHCEAANYNNLTTRFLCRFVMRLLAAVNLNATILFLFCSRSFFFILFSWRTFYKRMDAQINITYEGIPFFCGFKNHAFIELRNFQTSSSSGFKYVGESGSSPIFSNTSINHPGP